MKYAIVEISGNQYQVKVGDELEVEKLDVKPNTKVKFDQVYLLVDQDQITLGKPLVKNASVTATVIDQFKGKKIRVATYKAKSRYRRVKGHRQHLTRVKIEAILKQSSSREKDKSSTKKTAKATKK